VEGKRGLRILAEDRHGAPKELAHGSLRISGQVKDGQVVRGELTREVAGACTPDHLQIREVLQCVEIRVLAVIGKRRSAEEQDKRALGDSQGNILQLALEEIVVQAGKNFKVLPRVLEGIRHDC
jgi:hypothetical protein